jgi:PleD family two-component response regulator
MLRLPAAPNKAERQQTISLGCALLDSEEDNGDALKRAKHGGRNRCELAA